MAVEEFSVDAVAEDALVLVDSERSEGGSYTSFSCPAVTAVEARGEGFTVAAARREGRRTVTEAEENVLVLAEGFDRGVRVGAAGEEAGTGFAEATRGLLAVGCDICWESNRSRERGVQV